MTITVLPMDATAGAPSYTAKNARQAQAPIYGAGNGAVFSGRSGWRVGTPSTVVSVTSTTWTLNPAACMIAPAASLYQGMYGWASDAVITGAVTAADATNPRIDILYIQVNDSSAGDGSGLLSAPASYLAGTAAGTPVAPTLPARSLLVATISVPKSGAGSPTVTLNQQYFVTSGSPLPVVSQADRDTLTPYPGMQVIRLDANYRTETYSGSAWFYIGQTWNFFRSTGSDSTFNTANTSLVNGTITAAPAGNYRIDAQACLYASGGPAVGHIFSKAGSTQLNRRWDVTDASHPTSPYGFQMYRHGGGDLVVSCGYNVSSGTAIVTAQASGLTDITATFLGG